ncbi:MAG TPA: (Fe-S)-binding protein [Pyrinomonadaceae bacterium]|nr:(Fe-S)-binding protein [Pyrinomonadaceae bacterium]
MKVALFATCLVDQLCPQVGVSTVEVLRRLGCEVIFDERQTCCGQPAFNTGDRKEARKFAKRFIEIFEAAYADAIVSPSGSCTAMVKHFHDLFPNEENWRVRANKIAAKTYEFTSFLVNILKVEKLDSQFHGKVTWHDACHGLRELNLRSEPRALLKNLRNAEFVEMPNADSCCGFGGTFSVKYPEISVAILDKKIEGIEKTGADVVVSCDASCLMQIGGRLSRLGSKVKPMHIAEVLACQDHEP